MNIFEKILRNAADLTISIFGQMPSNDAQTAAAPLWAVIAVSVLGLLLTLLLLITGYVIIVGR